MASISLRSGGALGRRLLPCAEITAVHATAAAAPCHRQAHPLSPLYGATPARPTSLPYLPRVDLLSPVILSGQSPLPTSFSSMTYATQVDGANPAMVRRQDSLTHGVHSTSGSSSAPRQRQAETAPGLLRRSHLYTRITVSSLTSASYKPQTYAGATSFRRTMSSAASPSGGAPAKGIPTASAADEGDRTVSAAVAQTPNASAAHTQDGEKTASAALVPDVCKYDEGVVLDRLDIIDAKVDSVESTVHGIDAKVRGAIADCAHLSKEVELLKKQQEGSGDWTSVKIKGRNLNWLSVGSAVWEMLKQYFK